MPETGHGWDVLILLNRYPVLVPDPPASMREELYTTLKAYGKTLVVVETPQHDVDDLSDLSVDHIEKVLRAVVNKARETEADPKARYFLFLETRGGK